MKMSACKQRRIEISKGEAEIRNREEYRWGSSTGCPQYRTKKDTIIDETDQREEQ